MPGQSKVRILGSLLRDKSAELGGNNSDDMADAVKESAESQKELAEAAGVGGEVSGGGGGEVGSVIDLRGVVEGVAGVFVGGTVISSGISSTKHHHHVCGSEQPYSLFFLRRRSLYNFQKLKKYCF